MVEEQQRLEASSYSASASSVHLASIGRLLLPSPASRSYNLSRSATRDRELGLVRQQCSNWAHCEPFRARGDDWCASAKYGFRQLRAARGRGLLKPNIND
jgi:hypothetical protein